MAQCRALCPLDGIQCPTDHRETGANYHFHEATITVLVNGKPEEVSFRHEWSRGTVLA